MGGRKTIFTIFYFPGARRLNKGQCQRVRFGIFKNHPTSRGGPGRGKLGALGNLDRRLLARQRGEVGTFTFDARLGLNLS
jgi:hypothetical protein